MVCSHSRDCRSPPLSFRLLWVGPVPISPGFFHSLISAIKDYVAKERAADFKKWKSPALFLSPATNTHGDGRLNPRVINTVFYAECCLAGVEGHTPHDARHAMGRKKKKKTGNIAAVQRQLGHTNAAYSIQYARVTGQELADALDDR